ncbi:MAG: LLM class F420-dependent oxidoreductase [Microthrixaceae bacterium]
MHFAITHPLVRRPYHPEMVTGEGVSALAVTAEEAGFDGYGFTDHPAPTQDWLDAGGHDALDPFVALGFVAASTSTLRLLPNIVVLPYRNPFVVAKASATLDVLSGGRFILAVGIGYLEAEFTALGVDHAERAELFDEALGVLRDVWSTDGLSVDGRHFTAEGVTVEPKPTAQPHLPLWIGGNSAAARQRVADHGDGWCPFSARRGLAKVVGTAQLDDGERLEAGIADLHRRLEDAGRDPGEVDIAFSCSAGGNPAGDDFDPDAHLEGLERLEGLGVTWVQVGVPGDSPQHAAETMGRYGELVISQMGTDR